MRFVTLLSWIAAAQSAEAVARGGAVPVEAAGHPLTPWLALASAAMVATLFAAQWLVLRGRRR
jgi:hypothetical protein